MEVIYEDNHLLAAIKPTGLSTQPHEGESDNFLDRAKKWIKARYDKPGNVFLEPIHRLDKPASGIVLFAKTSKALSRLQALMRANAIGKTYTALVEGHLPEEQGTLENYLIHGSHLALVVSSTHPEAKRALLHYRVLRSTDKNSWVEISLQTGRYHQIRVQLAHVGCPIVGDKKYKSTCSFKPNSIALHHTKMSFMHPVTAQIIEIESAFSISN